MSSQSVSGEGTAKKTKEPRNTKITQQTLPACKPVLEPIWVVFIFAAIAAVLVPIGIVCLIWGLKAVEVGVRYDQVCVPANGTNAGREAYIIQNADNDKALECTVTLHIDKDMPAPVYVYYELNGYYQNHRRYVKSQSYMQLAGETKNLATSLCEPMENLRGDAKFPINPCGLVAWTFFNDTYEMKVQPKNSTLTTDLLIRDENIAFKADIKYRFGDYTPHNFNTDPAVRGGFNLSDASGGATPKQNERFMNWMRLAALPRFRKLWGRIDTDLKAGSTVTVTVTNRYNTYRFNGQKAIVLGTTTWLGSRNPFLGIAYIVTGGLSVVLMLVYIILLQVRPRKFGDPSALSFNRHAGGSG